MPRADAGQSRRGSRGPGPLPRPGADARVRRRVRATLRRAAAEEGDHLAWCRDRLDELGSRTSLLNPLWYAGSVAFGARRGTCSATAQPRLHGRDRAAGRGPSRRIILRRLPDDDQRSRAIIEQMKTDEIGHGRVGPSRRAARNCRRRYRADAIDRTYYDRHGILDLSRCSDYVLRARRPVIQRRPSLHGNEPRGDYSRGASWKTASSN